MFCLEAGPITEHEDQHEHEHDNNINIFGKSLFQPEYHILKKAFEEKLPKEIIIRLFENQN